MASLVPILALVFLLFTTFYHIGEARTFVVGGPDHIGWKVPESPKNNSLERWAAANRFRVGDSLEFDYDIKKDSVLEVTKENYENCTTKNPMKEYKEERTIVTLKVSGPHYFISGTSEHCHNGEKLIVVVLSPNHPPMPKPVPAAAPPTPSAKPPTSPATPINPSKSPSSPAPAPANNTAVGLVAGSGIFWAFVAVIGLSWA